MAEKLNFVVFLLDNYKAIALLERMALQDQVTIVQIADEKQLAHELCCTGSDTHVVVLFHPREITDKPIEHYTSTYSGAAWIAVSNDQSDQLATCHFIHKTKVSSAPDFREQVVSVARCHWPVVAA